MRIVIATPLYPPQLGGPAKYAQALGEEFRLMGHDVSVVRYGAIERLLPTGIRHVFYFLRLLTIVPGAHAILALDTWSVGLPSAWAAKLLRKRLVVRIGGDFLWEAWVERTGDLVPLSEFYGRSRKFSFKEEMIFSFTHFVLKSADVLAFNTAWQKDIWQKAYRFAGEHSRVVENFYPAPGTPTSPEGRVFVAAGRDIALKNKTGLHAAFGKVKTRHPGIELDEKPLPPKEHAARVSRGYAVIIASISEINPNSAIEAAALRKPFIAPLDCGAKDTLANMGLFVDMRDEKALEGAIEKLLEPSVYDACVAASASLKVRSWKEVAADFSALMI